MEAITFAALTRGGYNSGDVMAGMPPDWCQLARVPGGGWAAICYNAIDGKNHCLTCDKNGKRRFSNDGIAAAL